MARRHDADTPEVPPLTQELTIRPLNEAIVGPTVWVFPSLRSGTPGVKARLALTRVREGRDWVKRTKWVDALTSLRLSFTPVGWLPLDQA